MTNYALEVTNLYYSYDRNVEVLNGVTFNVKAGTYVSVIGHNGSGKSTLAKLIAGILDVRQGSVIKVFGTPLSSLNEERPDIGIVFQNPDNQFIGATVRDDIAFGLENKRVPHKDMDDIIEEYAAKVKMSEFLDKEPSNLSGGQKQRVAIAGVLAMKPRILLLDEATAMLDPKGKREIKEIILELRKEVPDLTIISITHDLEETLYSDEIIVMNEGKIVLQGTPDDIYKKHEMLTSIRLDLPFIFRIKLELEKVGIKVQSKDLKSLVEELWP
ncbi:MAG: Energy-coupling factor transporter ATP-binding protein EcfA1 [Tenericutes bacterium ADurb.Bin239]|nr:MAG: Energy-coupling factor transporter ATP-binding protein EcfA1 [Tenericutes bacterium ADurb.Bin239]